ncbi:MAG: class I tRNA ligase family protein [Phycisphaerales bacterium]
MGSLVRSAGATGAKPSGARRWQDLSPEDRRGFIDNQRLAYVGESTVNWCPALGTVLANDEVIDGKSERGGHPVLRKPLRQWMFRITAHADRLLRQLDMLAWPASTKKKQSDWIGRSEGAEIRFPLLDPRTKSADPAKAAEGLGAQTLDVFTTRPDTIFGATYMVVAPEHPLVERVLALGERQPGLIKDAARIADYVAKARNRSDVERQESKEKTGVPLGIRCVNPASGEPIPVWVADYVLMGYGTGAIMAVPAHDERDFAFARAFNLPMRLVVRPAGEGPAQFWEKVGERFGNPDYYSAVYVPPMHSPIAIDGLSNVLHGVPGAESAVEITPLDEGGWCILVKPPLEDVVIAHLPAPVYQFELGAARPDSGYACNSIGAGVGFDGMETPQAKEAVLAWLDKSGHGRKRTTCRLRDWTFSRQRYWGEPFPIVYDNDGNHYPVAATHLPVKLPVLDDYKPVESQDPQPLLAKAASWVETTAGQAGVDPALLAPDTPVRRETNTMPGSAGSSWYAIRYCDPKNKDRLVGKQAEAYWMGGENPGVDLYVGGDEHSVGHLLYARWWQNVLYDLGHVSTPEPFRTLFHQGLITAHAYQREDKTLVPTDEVYELRPANGGFCSVHMLPSGEPLKQQIDTPNLPEAIHARLARGESVFVTFGKDADVERFFGPVPAEAVTQIVAKMSKSLKNVVNPDDIIADYGADTFRLYEMYMGPLEMSKPWNTRDIVGLHRFLQRAWRLGVSEQTGEALTAPEADPTLEKLLHRTINKVGGDIDKLSFNTAIAALIEFVNIAGKGEAQTKGDSQPIGTLTRDQLSRLALCLAPFVPHMAEELWHRLGLRDKMGSVCRQAWPSIDEAMLRDDEVEVAVQLSGKVKTRVKVPADAGEDAIQSFVLSHPEVEPLVRGKSIKKVIVVPGRLVNIVAV